MQRSTKWAILAVMLGVVVRLALVPMAETDLFFHLRIGQFIVEHHAIPFRNLFSFTYPDHADPDLCWAFQVLIAGVYRLGGFSAIVVLKTALLAATAILLAVAALRMDVKPLPAAIAIVVAAVTAEPRMVERPHLMTFVGIAGLLWLLAEHERGRRVWRWIPLIAVVWANFHAGVFLLPVILATYAIGTRLDGKASKAPAWAALVAGVVMFATPAGTRLPSYLLWHTGLRATRNIDEFRVADPFDDPWFFGLIGCVLLALLVARRRIGWRRVLPLLVVGVLAWRSVRFVAEWAFIAAPTVAIGLDTFGIGIAGVVSRRARAVAGGTLVVVAAALLGWAWREPVRLGLAPDVVPFRAIDFVTQHGLRERMYEDLDVGCYLLWEGYPRYRVFQDARLPAYPDEFHRALDETPSAGFDALLRRYGVNTALIAEPGINMRSGSFDPAEWALVYRQPDALVFVRRISTFEDVIHTYEIPLRLRFSFAHGAEVEGIDARPERSPLSACEWQTRLAQTYDDRAEPERALDVRIALLPQKCFTSDDEAEVRYRWGARLQTAGKPRQAIAQYDLALAVRPGDKRVLTNRGYAYRLLGGVDKANSDLGITP